MSLLAGEKCEKEKSTATTTANMTTNTSTASTTNEATATTMANHVRNVI